MQHNFELEGYILGFGSSIKVLKPASLRRRIYEQMRDATEFYEKQLPTRELEASLLKLKWRGYAILENLYTAREVRRIQSLIWRSTTDEKRFSRNGQLFTVRSVLKEIPHLKPLLFNYNLCRLVSSFGSGYFLTKAIYFNKPPQSNWFMAWHQDVPVNVKEKIEAEGFHGWTNKNGLISVCPPVSYLQSAFTVRIHLDDTDVQNGALKVIPKAFTEVLTAEQIAEARENIEHKTCRVNQGGAQLMTRLRCMPPPEVKARSTVE
ncbi:MAG: phytanoyl-CoA dioxygenase [Pedobacter sp.]|nr:MAG: phytanoyl-CoA dioxygenase [Pedobacter sp.]